MSKIFSTVRARKPRHNAFSLSHEVKLSMNMGELVPVLCQEVVPGDRLNLKTLSLVRFAPMQAPLMHTVNTFCHSFFVPYRLLWNEWETFITGGPDGTAQPVFPALKVGSKDADLLKNGTLADYMGIPDLSAKVAGQGAAHFNALPFRAYAMIWNEYYRDQNLQEPIPYSTASGVFADNPELTNLLTLRRRAWEKDYFTSALPWAQKGDPVKIPIGDRAPLEFDVDGTTIDNHPRWSATGVNLSGEDNVYSTQTPNGSTSYNQGATPLPGTTTIGVAYDPRDTLYADLSSATATTINDLRTAVRLQEWFEANARGGSRYIEQILSHFNVKSSDSRLQRPEFLGGNRSPVHFSEVLQTSESAETPQANMAGHGVAGGVTPEFSRFFEEHGLVITIMSVLPRTAYQQGLPRLFHKYDRYDYFWPSFAHLGEQEIWNSEIYYDPDELGVNEQTFGYTPRYSEYKYVPSSVHGEFRDSLSYWHMSRIFANRPQLNAQFIESDPTNRVFAVTDPGVEKLWVSLYHDLKAIRPMPKYGTPSW